MIRRLAVFVLLTAAVQGCAEPESPPLRRTVGAHEVEFRVPDGWLHFDHGREQRFEKEIAQISMEDLGPATPEGFSRDIGYARDLFRRGQVEDSRTQLRGLHLRRAFPTEERWVAFKRSWKVVTDVGTGDYVHPDDVDSAYASVLAQISTLPDSSLETLVTRVMPTLDHGEQRDIAEQQALVIDGRQALMIDTWDRLSHDHRKRYLFVLNEGNLLAARTELGRWTDLEPGFDALVESLTIR